MVLTILYPKSQSESPEHLAVDIVIVHGLNGDPIHTWKNAETQAFWPQDFLPHDIKDARVLTFGYNANVTFGNTTADIRDYAKDLLSCLRDKREDDGVDKDYMRIMDELKAEQSIQEMQRPIIFIAHSLGGIVVKQALLLARLESRHESVSQHTIGIVFFGTPHKGSEKASYAKVLADLATKTMHKPSSKLIEALRSNSVELVRLTSDFRHQVSQYSIISFYERKPMKIFSSLIVEKESALLDFDEEDQIPVDANHRDMCKFSTRSDQVYEKLFKRVRKMIEMHEAGGLGYGILVSRSFNEYYDVPFNVSSVFTGRGDICQQLNDCCLPTVTPRAQTEQKRFVLYGMGGSGKTQICLKFAQDQREKFWGVFFIDLSSTNTADQGFLTLALRLGLGQEVDLVKRWFANTSQPWLLILDNADDPTFDISRYFPTGGRGTILITTRNRACTTHETVGSSEVFTMAVSEAITLLLRVSEEDVSESSRDLAKLVVETLGCLPLAVVHAGALIKQTLYSLENYCEAYSSNRQRLFGHETIQATSDYKHTVYTTWEVSVETIRNSSTQTADGFDRSSSETAKNALDLLDFFAFLHFDDISVGILERVWNNQQSEGTRSNGANLQIPRVLCQGYAENWDPFPTRQAIALLSSFSLIRFNKSNDRISLHPLVHAWMRDRLIESERAEYWITAVSTLSASTTWDNTITDYQYSRFLVPHIISCLQLVGDKLFAKGDGATERLEIAHIFAEVYSQNGYYKHAFALLVKARELCKETHAADTEISLQLEEAIALVYSFLGDYSKAITHQEQVQETRMRSEAINQEDPHMLNTKSLLGSYYCNVGRYLDALDLHQNVFNIRNRTLGDRDRKTLDSMGNLASVCVCLGQYEQALKLKETELQRRMELFGKESPVTFRSMIDLPFILSRLNRHEESLKRSEDNLQLSRNTFGDEHPDTLYSMHILGNIYHDVGHNQEAIELLVKVVEANRRVLGEEHPNTLKYARYLDRMKNKSDLNAGDGTSMTPEEGIRPIGSEPRRGPRGWLRRRYHSKPKS